MNKRILGFFFVPVLFAIPALAGILEFSRTDLHAFLNIHHTEVLDPIFVYGTLIGDGLTLLLVAVALYIFHSLRAGFFFTIASISASVCTQFLKRVVFEDVRRPSAYLKAMPDLHVPEGIELAQFYSFPSGHATAAFAMCLGLALIFDRRSAYLLFGVLAVFAAYTRVWISMHFTEDILMGALIGSFFTLITYVVFYRKWLAEDRFADSLIARARRK